MQAITTCSTVELRYLLRSVLISGVVSSLSLTIIIACSLFNYQGRVNPQYLKLLMTRTMVTHEFQLIPLHLCLNMYETLMVFQGMPLP